MMQRRHEKVRSTRKGGAIEGNVCWKRKPECFVRPDTKILLERFYPCERERHEDKGERVTTTKSICNFSKLFFHFLYS